MAEAILSYFAAPKAHRYLPTGLPAKRIRISSLRKGCQTISQVHQQGTILPARETEFIFCLFTLLITSALNNACFVPERHLPRSGAKLVSLTNEASIVQERNLHEKKGKRIFRFPSSKKTTFFTSHPLPMPLEPPTGKPPHFATPAKRHLLPGKRPQPHKSNAKKPSIPKENVPKNNPNPTCR